MKVIESLSKSEPNKTTTSNCFSSPELSLFTIGIFALVKFAQISHNESIGAEDGHNHLGACYSNHLRNLDLEISRGAKYLDLFLIN